LTWNYGFIYVTFLVGCIGCDQSLTITPSKTVNTGDAVSFDCTSSVDTATISWSKQPYDVDLRYDPVVVRES